MEKTEQCNEMDYHFEVSQHIVSNFDGSEFTIGKSYCHVENTGLFVNYDLDTLLDDSSSMQEFVKLAGALKNALPKSNALPRFHVSCEELKLLKFMAQVCDFYDLLADKLRFHPYVDAVTTLGDRRLGNLLNCNHLYTNTSRQGVTFDFVTHAQLAEIIGTYLETIRSADVAKRIDNIQKGVRENAKSIENHFGSLIKKHDTLLVIRINLCYQARLKDVGRLSHIELSDAISDRKCFLAEIDKRYPDWLGYVWKLEFAPMKGYHYHCILYFNGESLRADGVSSLALASLWKNITSERRGITFLCNLHKDKYVYPAICTIHYSEKEKINNFWFLAKYLSKDDLFSSVRRDGRRMGKNQVKSSTEKRGRPRKKLTDEFK